VTATYPAAGAGGDTPWLSVVVCTYSRCALLRDCLESLAAQTLSRDAYEVIVVDNNSSDGTPGLVWSWQRDNPRVRYVLEPRQGVAHARNRGWREAAGEFVAYIDDDTTADPEWCERVLHAFTASTPQPVAVGGEILPRLAGRKPWWFSPRMEVRSWGPAAGFLSSPTAHYGFSGANMAFQRRVLSEHGGFNTAFGMSGDKVWLGEEPELFMRIHRTQPYFWYDPAIQVQHYVPPSQLRLVGRLYRAFQTGRARRAIEKGPVKFGWVLVELGGACHLLRKRCSERPLAPMYMLVSVLERIVDRTGYWIGRTE
jgi:glucosyl-dolichyl phosphate glucuronosyltransferase